MLDDGVAEQVERSYIERARRLLGAVDVAAVTAELQPAAEPVLAGWWTNPDQPPGPVRLPNPWDDFQALAAMDEETDRICVRLLDALAEALGEAHGVDHDARYWECILGPFLSASTTAVADRRLFVRAARELAPDAPFLTGGASLRPPGSVSDGIVEQLRQPWNLALVERLAEMEKAPSRERDRPATEPAPVQATNAPVTTRAVRLALHLARHQRDKLARARAGRKTPAARQIAVLGQFKLTPAQLTALRRAVPGIEPAPSPVFRARSGNDHPSRARLADLPAAGALERAVVALLPALLPRSVLEDYEHLVSESRSAFGEPAHALHGNWAWGDLDGEYLGRCRSAGKRVAFAQHGGATYELAAAPNERHERRIGSMQLAWGRTEGPERTAPSPWIDRIAGSGRGGDHIVIVESLTPPLTWTYRFTSTPIGDQWFDEERRLVEFVDALGRSRKRVLLRRFPNPAYQGRRHPILAALPEASSGIPRTATEWMQRARLAVVAYPDTPFLEALAIGVPCIGVWNPDHWHLRRDAAPHMERLEGVGIVHRDPAVAAALVDEIADDPSSWWGDRDRQAARSAFLDRFAQTTGWLESWTAALTDLAAS